VEKVKISCKTFSVNFFQIIEVEKESFLRFKFVKFEVSPTFSSGKMRKMHKLVEQCVKSVDKILAKAAKEQKEVEMKTLMGNYTMDVIATCAFGTKIDTYNDPNNPFIKNAIKMFRGNILRSILFFTLKPLMKFLRISLIDSSVMQFFKSAVSTKAITDNLKFVSIIFMAFNDR
jgi:cytochrome P450 family 3 subfamily A